MLLTRLQERLRDLLAHGVTRAVAITLSQATGKRSALMQVGGSLIVAIIAFAFMSIPQVKYWAFYFPELLLVLLALIILIGRYTGYRLSELFRFRDFKEA